MKPLLDIRRLNKAFGGLRVADDVSLRLKPGELHAIIGPNGAGKSTLLAQIAGQIMPDSGKILLAGEDITALPVEGRARRGLARSFQVAALFDDLSVFDNMLLAVMGRRAAPWRLWGRVRSEEPWASRARAALEEAGLAARMNEVAAALSHGERRQLELAMALASAPKALLLDEPLAGLSAAEARAMTERLAALKGGLGILLVEHDMDAVFALADTLSVLVNGRIIASGPPQDVRRDPAVQKAYLE